MPLKRLTSKPRLLQISQVSIFFFLSVSLSSCLLSILHFRIIFLGDMANRGNVIVDAPVSPALRQFVTTAVTRLCGDNAASIASVLLEYGSCTLSFLESTTPSIDPAELRQALLALSQRRIVVYREKRSGAAAGPTASKRNKIMMVGSRAEKEQKKQAEEDGVDGTFMYALDRSMVIRSILTPQCIPHAGRTCGPAAQSMVQHIAKLGRASAQSIFDSTVQFLHLSADDVSETNMEQIKEDAESLFRKLLRQGYVVPCRVMSDMNYVMEDHIVDTHASTVVSAARRSGDLDEDDEDDLEDDSRSGTALSRKRKATQSVPLDYGDVTKIAARKRTNARNRAKLERDNMLKKERILQSEPASEFELGYERFVLDLRTSVVLEYVADRFGPCAHGLISTFLEIAPAPLSLQEPYSPILDQTLYDAMVERKLIDLRSTFDQQLELLCATSQLCMIRRDMNASTSVDSEASGAHGRNDANASAASAMSTGAGSSSAAPAVQLQIYALVRQLKEWHAMRLVRQKYGSVGVRIVRALIERKWLEDTTVEDVAATTRNNARSVLFHLHRDQIAFMQDVPKSSDRAATKSAYLWTVKWTRVFRRTLDMLYKSWSNLVERLFAEQQSKERLLAKMRQDSHGDQVTILPEEQAKFDEHEIAAMRIEHGVVELNKLLLLFSAF
jgi:transcription initiation factor IIE alpha subunit